MTRALVGVLALAVSLIIARSLGHRIPLRATRRRREASRVVLAGMLTAAALATLLSSWISRADILYPSLGGALDVLSVVLVAPVVEELVFRELPCAWASREQWREGFLVVASGLAFAAYHRLSLLFQPEAHAEAIVLQSLLAFPFGIALMVLRLRYGGLGGCMLVHATFNLCLVAGLHHRMG